MNQKLIKKYNTPDTLLIIGSFPERGQNYSPNQDAISWYLKNRLTSLQKKIDFKAIVFTQTKKDIEIYEDQNFLVIRCFKRNSPVSWVKLARFIAEFHLTKNLLLQFEFATFGDIFTTILFPLLLGIIKLLGKHVTLELHQALFNLNKLSGHIGQTKNNLKIKIMSHGIKLFYLIITQLSDHIIVLEEELKKRLKSLVNENKISVITLGVNPNVKTTTKKTARQKLNLGPQDFIILNFGFLTWYKGSDLSVKAFQHFRSKNTKLILAGGPSITQKNKNHYQKFITRITRSASKTHNIIATGHVDEKEVALYFSAADLVILPYRTFMSSSGPLSLAISHEKPVLLSRALKPYLNSYDFNHALKQADLNPNEIFVSNNPKQLAQAIRLHHKPQSRQKLTKFTKVLKDLRSYDRQAEEYLSLVNNHPKTFQLATNLSVNLKYARSS